MSVPKIKNIVIAALVLINAFFLVFIVADSIENSRSERIQLENLTAVFNASGIILDPDNIRNVRTPLPAMRSSRNIQTEERIAQAVLGSVDIAEHGVIINEFTRHGAGTATFYSGGNFDIMLYDGVISSDDEAETVRRILNDMGIEVSDVFESEYGIFTAFVAYRGFRIFNNTIRFIFGNGSLRAVFGRYIAAIEPADDSEIPSVITSLLAFLAYADGPDEILQVEAGFYSESGMIGDGFLKPVWLISTNSGRRHIANGTDIWQITDNFSF